MKKYLFLFVSICFLQFGFGQDLLTNQSPIPCLNKHFSIVAHVVKLSPKNDNTGVSEDAIRDGVASLKNFFDPICVTFDLCKIDTIENHLYDDLSEEDWNEMQTQFNEDNRINIYFVSTALPNGSTISDPCGLATLNGINKFDKGGIVIFKGECVKPSSNTFAHMMGHYFNLLHTFEGNGIELVNGANCSIQGDLICDTPADPFDPANKSEKWIDFECVFISTLVDANGEYYRPDVGNIMSYYSNCACGFTHDQYIRMANAASTSETW